MGKAHFVKIFDTITNLAKYAVDLWATHLSGHDDAEEIKWGVLHYLRMLGLEGKVVETSQLTHLVIVTVVGDDIKGVYDIGVFECRTYTKLGSNFFLIFFFTLARTFGSKLLCGINGASILGIALYETNCATGTSTKDTA